MFENEEIRNIFTAVPMTAGKHFVDLHSMDKLTYHVLYSDVTDI
jgi:hypothetical protein